MTALDKAGQILADELKSEIVKRFGSLCGGALIPLGTAAVYLGVTKDHAKHLFAGKIIDLGERQKRVRFVDVENLIAERTR